jgi:hypothetical protein
VREEAAIRKALKKAKEEDEAAVKAAARMKLEEEALAAERLESGYVEPIPESEVIPVLETGMCTSLLILNHCSDFFNHCVVEEEVVEEVQEGNLINITISCLLIVTMCVCSSGEY